MAFYQRQAQELTTITALATRRLLIGSVRQTRAVWVRDRSHAFLDGIVAQWDEAEWKRNFRIGRPTFHFLCTELRPYLQRANVVRKPLTVEERIAISLWRLGTNIEYRSIAHLFGVGLSSVCVTVHEVCTAIVEVLSQRYIRIPTGENAQQVVDGFLHTWGFPQCFGAIDGSHIPIITPKDNPIDYYNRKKFHSIVLQALVDHEYKFMNTYVGWPGSVHDARVLANSVVFERGEAGTLVPDKKRHIGTVDIPIVVLGDPAYPLLPWLIKPFTGTGLSRKQRRFNYQHSRARVVVECAFGRLKGRWRTLLKRNDTNISFLPTLVTACCVLHNLCEVHGDSFNDDWLPEEDRDEPATAQTAAAVQTPTAGAVAIRNALCDYFD